MNFPDVPERHSAIRVQQNMLTGEVFLHRQDLIDGLGKDEMVTLSNKEVAKIYNERIHPWFIRTLMEAGGEVKEIEDEDITGIMAWGIHGEDKVNVHYVFDKSGIYFSIDDLHKIIDAREGDILKALKECDDSAAGRKYGTLICAAIIVMHFRLKKIGDEYREQTKDDCNLN